MSMLKNESVYVAWQSPDSRDWHVVGNLQSRGTDYSFNYTCGVKKLKKFTPFSGMDDLTKTYISEELFPLFKNRLLSPRRPEYPFFIQWLGLNSESATPIQILGRSGGMRTTDQLQIFKKIEVDENGVFEHKFFSHGLSYLSKSTMDRVMKLSVGEELKLCPDLQNDYDANAVLIRASSPAEIIGYCPRYLAEDIKSMLEADCKKLKLSVVSISDEAPMNYRLLCSLRGVLGERAASNLMNQEEFVHFS